MAIVMGILLLWLGSLILAFVADTAFDVRLTLSAVHRAEQRARDEQAARSLTESFARVLQLDLDRARDSLDDEWASFDAPMDRRYDGLWPKDSKVVARDSERAPPPQMLDLVLGSSNGTRSVGERASEARGMWLNVLTASVEAWEALGFSNRCSQQLVEQASRGIGTVGELTAIPSLESREGRVLRRLIQADMLKMRSEHFVLVCVVNGTTFESMLHREPGRGQVRLVYLRRAEEYRER